MGTVRLKPVPQLNAFGSLGVTPPSGRDGIRPVALEHGHSGPGFALLPDEAEAVTRRAAEWNSSLRPHNPFEFWLAEQIALESLRVEHCQDWERTLGVLAAERAVLCWDEDRSLAAELLASRLGSKPALVSGQLRQTKQGCALLIGRWDGLAAVLREGREWDEAQRALALDLLGTPLELRTGTTPVDAPAGVGDVREFRLGLARAEVERLERLRAEVLELLDAREQAAAARGLPAEPDRATAQARRYEAACMRRLQWAVRQFKAGRHASDSAPLPGCARIPASAPVMAPVGPDRAESEAMSNEVPSRGTDRTGDEAQGASRVGCDVETGAEVPVAVQSEAELREAVPVAGTAEDAGEDRPKGGDDALRLSAAPIRLALLGSDLAPRHGPARRSRRASRIAGRGPASRRTRPPWPPSEYIIGRRGLGLPRFRMDVRAIPATTRARPAPRLGRGLELRDPERGGRAAHQRPGILPGLGGFRPDRNVRRPSPSC